jgi:hypothetical protein
MTVDGEKQIAAVRLELTKDLAWLDRKIKDVSLKRSRLVAVASGNTIRDREIRELHVDMGAAITDIYALKARVQRDLDQLEHMELDFHAMTKSDQRQMSYILNKELLN